MMIIPSSNSTGSYVNLAIHILRLGLGNEMAVSPSAIVFKFGQREHSQGRKLEVRTIALYSTLEDFGCPSHSRSHSMFSDVFGNLDMFVSSSKNPVFLGLKSYTSYNSEKLAGIWFWYLYNI